MGEMPLVYTDLSVAQAVCDQMCAVYLAETPGREEQRDRVPGPAAQVFASTGAMPIQVPALSRADPGDAPRSGTAGPRSEIGKNANGTAKAGPPS
jgi:hypothetical protein